MIGEVCGQAEDSMMCSMSKAVALLVTSACESVLKGRIAGSTDECATCSNAIGD